MFKIANLINWLYVQIMLQVTELAPSERSGRTPTLSQAGGRVAGIFNYVVKNNIAIDQYNPPKYYWLAHDLYHQFRPRTPRTQSPSQKPPSSHKSPPPSRPHICHLSIRYPYPLPDQYGVFPTLPHLHPRPAGSYTAREQGLLPGPSDQEPEQDI